MWNFFHRRRGSVVHPWLSLCGIFTGMVTTGTFIHEQQVSTHQWKHDTHHYVAATAAASGEVELEVVLDTVEVNLASNLLTVNKTHISQDGLEHKLADVNGITIDLDRKKFEEGLVGISNIKLGEVHLAVQQEQQSASTSRLLGTVLDLVDVLTGPASESDTPAAQLIDVGNIELDPTTVKLLLGPGVADLAQLHAHVGKISIDGTKKVIHLNQIKVTHPDTYEDDGQLVLVDEINVGFDLNALLMGKFNLQHIDVLRPNLTLSSKDDESNVKLLLTNVASFIPKFEKSVTPPANAPTDTAVTPAPVAEAKGKDIAYIPNLNVQQATVTIKTWDGDEYLKFPLTVNDILFDEVGQLLSISEIRLNNPKSFAQETLLLVPGFQLNVDTSELLDMKAGISNLVIEDSWIRLRHRDDSNNLVLLLESLMTFLPDTDSSRPRKAANPQDIQDIKQLLGLLPQALVKDVNINVSLDQEDGTQVTLPVTIASAGANIKEGEAGLSDLLVKHPTGYDGEKMLSLSSGRIVINMDDLLNGKIWVEHAKAGELDFTLLQVQKNSNVGELLTMLNAYLPEFEKESGSTTQGADEPFVIPAKAFSADDLTARVHIYPKKDTKEPIEYKLNIKGAEGQLPSNWVSVEEVTLGNAPGFKMPFLAQLKDMRINLDTKTLLSDRIEVESVRVSSMEVYGEQYGAKLNVDGVIQVLTAIRVENDENATEGSAAKKTIFIKELRIEQTKANFKIGDSKVDSVDLKEIVLKDVEISGSNTELPIQVIVQLLPPIVEAVLTGGGDAIPGIMVNSLGNSLNVMGQGVEELGKGVEELGKGLDGIFGGDKKDEENKDKPDEEKDNNPLNNLFD